MESFAITCTTCSARLKVRDPAAIGRILTCPKCGSMVEVVAPADGQGKPLQNGRAVAALPAVEPALSAAHVEQHSTSESRLPTTDSPASLEGAAFTQAQTDSPEPASRAATTTSGSTMYAIAGCALGFVLAVGLWTIAGKSGSNDSAEQARADDDANAEPANEAALDAAPTNGQAPAAGVPADATQDKDPSEQEDRSDGKSSDRSADHVQPSNEMKPVESAVETTIVKTEDAAESNASVPLADAQVDGAAAQDVAPVDAARQGATTQDAAPADTSATGISPVDSSDSAAPLDAAPVVSDDKPDGGQAVPSLSVQEIEERLEVSMAALRFRGKLSNLVAMLAELSAAPIEVDLAAIRRADISIDPEVSLDLKDTTARLALEEAVSQAALGVKIEIGRAVVVPPDHDDLPASED